MHYFTVDPSDQFIEAANTKCNPIKLPMTVAKMEGYNLYNFSVSHLNITKLAFHSYSITFFHNFQFVMYILNEQEEGLYNLYFHACPNYQHNLFPLNFEVSDFVIIMPKLHSN